MSGKTPNDGHSISFSILLSKKLTFDSKPSKAAQKKRMKFFFYISGTA